MFGYVKEMKQNGAELDETKRNGIKMSFRCLGTSLWNRVILSFLLNQRVQKIMESDRMR